MIGLVTIGQAPRNDITASMFEDAMTGQILQFGALDGLNESEISALAPGLDDNVLVSRLTDGTEVELGKSRITPLVQSAVDRAVEAGASLVCVLCTGSFSGLTSDVPMVFPDHLVLAMVDALLPAGRLGILMPHEGQREYMIRKWSRSGRDVVTSAVSPYGSAEDLTGEARRLCEAGAQLLVMDCMGFTREMERTVRAVAQDIPVVLSNGVVGALIIEAWGLNNAREDPLTV